MSDKFAFPGSPDMSNGMTLRDCFAAQALTGVIANGALGAKLVDDAGDATGMAIFCYNMADLMLRARDAAPQLRSDADF